MPKRQPGAELNHENWNQEDEKEEAGHFSAASKDVLQSRQLKVAKRRAIGGNTETSGAGGLFKGFTGFTCGLKPETSKPFSFGVTASTTNPSPFGVTQQPSTSISSQDSEAKEDEVTKEHLSHLRNLNRSVLSWISRHVNENPNCDLTPVFKDYEKHLAEIERKYPYQAKPNTNGTASHSAALFTLPAAPSISSKLPDSSKDSSTSSGTPSFSGFSTLSKNAPSTVASVTSTSISFQSTALQTTSSTSNLTTTPFSFLSSTNAKASTEDSGAAVKPPVTATTASSGFTFGSSSSAPSFSFGSGGSLFAGFGKTAIQPPQVSQTSENDKEDEEYEPPKPETREIKEEGATYTKRCKLFYMAESKEWKEKGIGNLHVKPLGDRKVQFIIRADTTLGTILLNVIITKDMSLKTSKNNLSFACIPNPPLNPKVEPQLTSFLVRVKTEEDASDLLAAIDRER